MHRLKLYIFTIIVLIIYNSTFAQDIVRTINWYESDNTDIPKFNNSYGINKKTGVPYYYEAIPIGNISKAKIDLVIEKTSPLSTFNSDISGNISRSFDFEYDISRSNNQNILQIKINPLRRGNSGLEKLDAFRIDISPAVNYSKRSVSTSNSVLASGKWYKIAVEKNGIYKISYDKLVELGFSDPSKISVFGNGGKQLSFFYSTSVDSDLSEVPVSFNKGADNIFNSGDFIYFYATGPVHWEYNITDKIFEKIKHHYSNRSYYFITDRFGTAKQITKKASPGAANRTSNKHLWYASHEVQDTNLLMSGRSWYGETFDIETSKNFEFTFPNSIASENSHVNFAAMAQSKAASSYTITINGTSKNLTLRKTDFSNYEKGVEGKSLFTFNQSGDKVSVNITYNKPFPSSIGWLDYIDINRWCSISYTGTTLEFADPSTLGAGNITRYTVATNSSDIKVWDVTDINNTQEVELTTGASSVNFSDNSNSLRRYVAFNISNASDPVFIGGINNQNLHADSSAELIIITTNTLYGQAQRLAEFHKSKDNISYKIFTPEPIYNEYSSGSPDVCAIRNFLGHMYNQPESKLKYLLFMGDGTYNNSPDWVSKNNVLLCYQSKESLIETGSYVSDDFFGLLDDGEGEGEGLLDIGIGRIPVRKSSGADIVYNKIVKYYENRDCGIWQNRITFIGDDGDNNTHVIDAEKLSNLVNTNHPDIITDKIYLDSYIMEKKDVELYPDVNKAINNAVKQGSVILNYSGHGSPSQLAHEYVITREEIDSWDNKNLPVFVTATCSFSKWDNNYTSAGEYILLKKDFGGIALFSTTRIVYSGPNFTLNNNFYKNFKKKDADGKYIRMGDVIKQTKIAMPNDSNKRNFSLLGDPLLRLALPENDITIDEVTKNGSLVADTLKAFDKITIKGSVRNGSGVMSDFSGDVWCTVYDKQTKERTLANKGGTPFEFESWKNIIFQGKASVSKGIFTIDFIVPKDISYKYGPGKITAFACNNSTSASGNKEIVVGGTGTNKISDSYGPAIDLYMNNSEFVEGGMTNDSPKLIVELTDESGINTMNNSVGHDITATIDNDDSKTINLNQFYNSNSNTYKSGRAEYYLEKLENGTHTIRVKAWDIVNNSNEAEIEFVVANSEELAIQHLLNYPNPFTERTTFYFNHNRPNTYLETVIQVFTVSGKLVKTLTAEFVTDSFRSEPIEWDGLDDFGNKIGRGVYIYKLKLRSNSDKAIEKIEKLVILK
jgi:hypothetical protein